MSDGTLYDESGEAVAYFEPDGAIYLYSGEPVAWLDGQTNIYDYGGMHLGFFVGGWIRDHWGDCVLFTEDAIGGPVKPVRGVQPVRGAQGAQPVRGVPEVPPVSAVPSLGWSRFSGVSFFVR